MIYGSCVAENRVRSHPYLEPPAIASFPYPRIPYECAVCATDLHIYCQPSETMIASQAVTVAREERRGEERRGEERRGEERRGEEKRSIVGKSPFYGAAGQLPTRSLVHHTSSPPACKFGEELGNIILRANCQSDEEHCSFNIHGS